MPLSFFSALLNRLNRSSTIVLMLVLSALAITPLFAPGYFYEAHDGRHSVFYLIQFDASIRDGALWPRWAMHHTQGYGYPTFIIQAPIGFYLAELFILLGAGYTTAAKWSWAVGTFIGGLGVYQLMRTWLRRYDLSRFEDLSEHSDNHLPTTSTHCHLNLPLTLIAAVAGLIYVFAPYHLLGIYVRSALNDTLLLAWFPWVFLAFDQLLTQGHTEGWSRRLAVAAFTLGGILLTHTFALISFTPLLISFILFRLGLIQWQKKKFATTFQTAILALLAGLAALALYAVFLLPLLLEGSAHLQDQVYVADTYDFHRHFVYWGQFFSPFWGYGFSDDPMGAMDGMGFQVGALLLMLALLALYLTQQRTGTPTKSAAGAVGLPALSIYLALVSVALMFLMTPGAAPLWESVSLLAVIQFPWRLLSLTAFTLSMLAGIALWQLYTALYSDGNEQMGGALNLVTAKALAGEQKSDGQRASPNSTNTEAAAGIAMVGLLAIFGSHTYIDANLQSVEPWREDGRAIVFFERDHPDMMGYTEWVDGLITESPMTPNYADGSYTENYTESGLLDRLLIVEGSGEVLSRYSRGSSMGGVVQLDSSATVRILVYHFPGWQVTINGKPVEHSISKPEGLIEVQLPEGKHEIAARMGATGVRRLGSIISTGTLLILLILLFWGRRTSTRITTVV